jgi:nitrous oxide reductase
MADRECMGRREFIQTSVRVAAATLATSGGLNALAQEASRQTLEEAVEKVGRWTRPLCRSRT